MEAFEVGGDSTYILGDQSFRLATRRMERGEEARSTVQRGMKIGQTCSTADTDRKDQRKL